jgi:DNA-binding beta-propeller fold protein YncE
MRHLLILAAFTVAACETTDEPTDEVACDPTGGVMCTYLGIPGTAMFAAEGLDRLESPTYLPVDGTWGPDGYFYYIDFNNHRIRRVAPDGVVTSVAGSGFLGDGPEGPAPDFAFNHPTNLTFHPNDDTQLYVAAWHNSRINVIDLTDLSVRFECGTGARDFGGDGADAHDSKLDLPSSVQFDEVGNLYIMDQANQLIRKVDPAGVISTIAGKIETRQINHDGDPATPPVDKTRGWAGYAGDGGPALEARFQASVGQAADPASRFKYFEGKLYLVDTDNHLVRVIDLAAGTVDRVAGFVEVGPHPTPAITDPVNLGYGFENGSVDTARFYGPRDIDIAADGTMYIADTENHCIRRIKDGMVDTVAGVCGTPGSDDDGGAATSSHLWRPYGVALSPDETTLIIADTQNQVFRIVGL